MVFLNDVTIGSLPDPEFLIDEILPEGLTEMHGRPGSRKSFLALEMAMSIATGLPSVGRAVKRGNVLYVLGEGSRGTKKRIDAWKAARGLANEELAGVHFHNQAVQFLNEREMDAFSRLIEESGIQPVLVIFDTFSRCFEGADENSAEAVSRAMGAIQRLMNRHSTSVLVVHHTNKGGKAERGSSVIRGATEGMLSLRAESQTSVVLECVKMKDGAAFEPLRLAVHKVEESCVLIPDGAVLPPPERRSELSSAHISAMAHLASEPLPFEAWCALVEQSGGKRSTFKNHRKHLVDAGLVHETELGYALTEAGERALRARAKANSPYNFGLGLHGNDPGLADAA